MEKETNIWELLIGFTTITIWLVAKLYLTNQSQTISKVAMDKYEQ